MKIEIWSDVVCPWCYIGKRRLERALEDRGADAPPVEIVWRSFELDPAAPREPTGKLDEALAEKYGTSVEEARAMMDGMTRTAAEEGLELHFERAQRGNTLDAHRVLHLAAARGLQSEMKERLFRAYMTEGRAISDREELTRLAAEIGLDPEEVRAMLETDRLEREVRMDQARAMQLGVRGVPFFVFDDRLAVSGAQPSHILREVLERVEGGGQPEGRES